MFVCVCVLPGTDPGRVLGAGRRGGTGRMGVQTEAEVPYSFHPKHLH